MPAIRRKSWLAGALSLCVPGLGQMYNGQARKGVLFYGLSWIVGLAAVVMLLELSLAPFNIIVPLGIILAGYLYILGDAVTTARRHRETFQPQWYNTWYVFLAIIGLAAFVLQPAVGSTLRSRIRAFKIPSGSMENTLFIGDHLLVKRSRASDTPLQRFAVIVLHAPWAEQRDFVKRIIALPGEWVQLRDQQVSINDQPLREPFAYYSAPGRYSARGRWAKQFGPVRVPKRGDTIEIRGDQRLYVNGEPVPIPPETYHLHDQAAPLTGFAVFYGPLFPAGATLQQPMGPLVAHDDYYFTLGDKRDDNYDSRYWGFVPRANIVGTAKRLYWSWDDAAKRVRWERIGQEIR